MEISRPLKTRSRGQIQLWALAALAIFALALTTGCPDGGSVPGPGSNDIFCSNSEQNRCYDAGCTDGDNSDSPNPSAASCGGECREYYCDGYCECEIWLINEECSECM